MRRRALYLIALTLCCLLSHAQVTDDVIDSETLSSVTVSARRTRYSRRNNPAVELMRKVIANKKQSDLRSKDYFTYTKYEKMTFSLNEVSDKVFEEGEYKRFAFLKDHVERSPQTGKLILDLLDAVGCIGHLCTSFPQLLFAFIITYICVTVNRLLHS